MASYEEGDEARQAIENMVDPSGKRGTKLKTATSDDHNPDGRRERRGVLFHVQRSSAQIQTPFALGPSSGCQLLCK